MFQHKNDDKMNTMVYNIIAKIYNYDNRKTKIKSRQRFY